MEISKEFCYRIDETLNPAESFFKDLYLKQQEVFLELPHRLEELNHIMQLEKSAVPLFSEGTLSDSLAEETYFVKNQDVSVYTHTRYLPAIIHTHTFFEVCCLLKGQCTNYIQNQKFEMIPGDICIIAPATEHTISAFSDDCLIINFLIRTSTFEKAFFGTLADTDILSDFFLHTLYHSKDHPYLFFRTQNDPEILLSIGNVYQENLRNKRYKNRMLNAILSTFFLCLLRNHEKDVVFSAGSESVPNENIIFLLHYIQESYKSLTLKQLSGFFNYSERQLQRIIKAYTGSSFSENIHKLKMKHAADFLSKSELSVAEIAEQTGYSDVSNFRHFFKRYYGMTPTEFRDFSKKDLQI